MARNFNSANPDYVLAPTPIANPTTLTLSAWMYDTSVTGVQTILALGQGTIAGLPVMAYIRLATDAGTFICQAGQGPFAQTASSYSANTWNHIAGTGSALGTANAPLAIFMNGANKATATSANGSPFVTSLTKVSIAIDQANSLAEPLNGRVADAALWNVVLSDTEIKALALGARPINIRPTALIGWWPLDGLQSPEPDLSGLANNGVLTGTTLAAGPPVMMFTPRWPQFIPSAAAASSVVFRRSLSSIGTRVGSRQAVQ